MFVPPLFYLLARRTFAMPTALSAIAVTDDRCTNDAQHQTRDQECEPFQTTFHNTVPPKLYWIFSPPAAEKISHLRFLKMISLLNT